MLHTERHDFIEQKKIPVRLIDGNVVFVENRNGNSSSQILQEKSLNDAARRSSNKSSKPGFNFY
jgi:hypothetical protein